MICIKIKKNAANSCGGKSIANIGNIETRRKNIESAPRYEKYKNTP